MSKIFIQVEIDSQTLLTSFSKMQLQDLEFFAKALEELIAKKKGMQQLVKKGNEDLGKGN